MLNLMAFDPRDYINTVHWSASRLGLGRITTLLDRLGNPQDSLRFVHVAGTNGKGSTCAYIASVLSEAGLSTGVFTSPYVDHFEERICIDGREITLQELTDVVLCVREHADAMDDHPSEFELMCASAMLYFARKGCDIVVLEVGLGGRFDATNVIASPEVCVITRIGIDHTEVLGNTLSAIAAEKAGIIKDGCPVVTCPQEQDAAQVLKQVSEKHSAPLSIIDVRSVDISPLRLDNTPDPMHCRRQFRYADFSDMQTRLLGKYQPFNAALALAAIQVLRTRGFKLADDSVFQGIARAYLPGRFEVTSQNPLFIIDGAHNPQAVAALVETVQEVMPKVYPVFLIGFLKDKDYPAMIKKVFPLSRAFVCIEPLNSRAVRPDELAAYISSSVSDFPANHLLEKPYSARSIADGVAHAQAIAGPQGCVIAFGSLYSVAAIKRCLYNGTVQPSRDFRYT